MGYFRPGHLNPSLQQVSMGESPAPEEITMDSDDEDSRRLQVSLFLDTFDCGVLFCSSSRRSRPCSRTAPMRRTRHLFRLVLFWILSTAASHSFPPAGRVPGPRSGHGGRPRPRAGGPFLEANATGADGLPDPRRKTHPTPGRSRHHRGGPSDLSRQHRGGPTETSSLRGAGR